ncbi:hypothetical protein [Vreelandella massiliensis]|uniref:hypothetical protein n=1 Tax=Vreelandella massiliensis TaxID=1816686 RepID=UPI00096AAB36|nr:hypothetical protein [Halomonas massiliensis]
MAVRKLLGMTAISLAVAGCSTMSTENRLSDVPERPSSDWLQENYPLYKTAAVEYPTTLNVSRYHQLKAHMEKLAPAVERGHRITRGLTLSFSNASQGGAAMRQPGYVHVVNSDFNTLRKRMQDLSDEAMARHLVDTAGLSEVEAEDAIQALKSMEPSRNRHARDWLTSDPQGYSMYEISRWTRFCDGGSGMDEADWRFVTDEGRSNAPDLITYCDMPSHDYYDYLRAWERFCEMDGATQRDLSIVRDSVRPKSTVSDCKALNL